DQSLSERSGFASASCSEHGDAALLALRRGWSRPHPPPQPLQPLVQLPTPIVARVGEQPLAAPEPTDAAGDSPLGAALLAPGLPPHALAEVPLPCRGQADAAAQAGDPRLAR